MKKLDDEFDEYRDCLRVVWNLALRHRLKGLDSFRDISWALLGGLVLDELTAADPVNTSRTSDGYIPGLGVAIEASKPEVLLATNLGNGVIWKDAPIEAIGNMPSYYIDVFDFRNDDGMLEFEYIKAYMRCSDVSSEFGKVVLLRRSHVSIVDLS
jgi:hypothetical protein